MTDLQQQTTVNIQEESLLKERNISNSFDLIIIEDIIKSRMKNCDLYEKVVTGYCPNDNYNIFFGVESPPKDLSKEDQLRWLILEKRVRFSYIDKKLCFVFDENWDEKELKEFIDKCLNDEKIIKALNKKYIKLDIKTIQERHSFKSSEIEIHKLKKELENHRNYGYKIINSLESIGINAKDIYNWETFGILN